MTPALLLALLVTSQVGDVRATKHNLSAGSVNSVKASVQLCAKSA